jgi:hypothetical protein
MKRLDFRTVVVVLLAAAVGCKGDPTADLRTGASKLSLNPDLMYIDQGSTKPFDVTIRDEQLNPVAGTVEVTSSDAAVLTVAPDEVATSADGAKHSFIVTAVGPGQARLLASAGSVHDSALVTVFPPSFNGSFSTKTPKGGDTLRIIATASLKFDPAAAAVTAPGGLVAPILNATADQLTVLTPFAAAGKWAIAGVRAVSYPPGLVVTLQSDTVVTPTGRLWSGDTNYTTAPTIAVPTTKGASTRLITNLAVPANGPNCAEFGPPAPGNSIGPCVIYKFTLADTTTLRFTAQWNSTGDMDAYVCDATGLPGCFESGGSGAGSANPENIANFKYTAGTHYFVVEQFRGPTPGNISVTILRP